MEAYIATSLQDPRGKRLAQATGATCDQRGLHSTRRVVRGRQRPGTRATLERVYFMPSYLA